MKIKPLYIICSFLLVVVMVLPALLSNSGGRAASASIGNTGAPGDQFQGTSPIYCNNCHGGNAYLPSCTIQLLDSATLMPTTTYLPQKAYLVRTKVTPGTGSPLRYGYQLCSTKGNTSTGINTWYKPGSNVQISPTNGKTYAEHTFNSTTGTFDIYWKSPAAGTGQVRFYACGVTSNANMNDNGDGSKNTSLVISEGSVATLETQNTIPEIRLQSTLVNDKLTFINLTNNERFQLSIFSLNGHLVTEKSLFENTMDINHLISGVYLIRLSIKGELVYIGKFVKT